MEGGPAVDQFATRRIRGQHQYRADGAMALQRQQGFAAQPQIQPQIVVPRKPATHRFPASKSLYQRGGKRAFDFAFSAAFLVGVGSWLFPLLAVAIRANSSGPVFFRQKRVGLNGEVFTCLKFRTMVHQPDAGFCQAQKNDARITRVGAFLRRTNLDEVPQFINVLRGDMSVIGPRPHVQELDGMFKDLIPAYASRNVVKPGVSGLAQVSGCRGETRSVREMNHRVRFDVFYCRNVSFALDVKLVFLTVLRALRGDERAY